MDILFFISSWVHLDTLLFLKGLFHWNFPLFMNINLFIISYNFLMCILIILMLTFILLILIVLYLLFYLINFQFSSVQSLNRVRIFATPWITACQVSLSITKSRSSFKLMSIKWVTTPSHLILCHPLFLLPPIAPSVRGFPMSQIAWGSQSIGVSASASVLPMNTQDWPH